MARAIWQRVSTVVNLSVLTVAVTVLSASVSARALSVDEPTMQERLDRLCELIEARRIEMNTPGLALAVVKDDEVILARGFGMADLEGQKPVTAETLFAVGSTTKAFTATLIGMLIDEGKMDWDDPVTKHLPYFRLDVDAGDVEDAEVTIRDMLCHRTGFTRMSVLWAGGGVPRERILRTATKAEPWAPFRERFYYNNVMYLAAGMAAGKAAGTDWDSLLAKRLLKPLGMNDSNTSVRQSQKDERLALGYFWDVDKEEFERAPMRVLDTIAPAGAINSNVNDMAQWLRFQLGRGAFEGDQLVSREQFDEIWTGQIDLSPDVSYGLGWFTREWQGQPVIEHAGGIDGFTAQVALLPESNIGFVMLANSGASAVPSTSINLVWDTLVDAWEDEIVEAAEGAPDFQPYLGKYSANFGPFRDAEFTVQVQNDNLAVDVPGQMVYELKAPDEEGKWYFQITDTIAVSFDKDEAGDVVGMKMYQGGMTFELPRAGVEIAAEIDLNELTRYLGTYHAETLGREVEAVIQNNRLALDVPGQMVFELHAPNEEGKWIFRVTDAIAVRFNESDDTGEVESLTMYQEGQEFEMPRTKVPELPAPLPSIAEIHDLRKSTDRAAALRQVGTTVMSGSVQLLQSGVTGELRSCFNGVDQFRVDADFGRFGFNRAAVSGDRAWSDSSFIPFMELSGVMLEQAQKAHPAVLFSDWRLVYNEESVVRNDELDGRSVYVVRLAGGEAEALQVYVDAESGDILKAEGTEVRPGVGAIPMETTFEDYREWKGLRLPYRITTSNEQSGHSRVEIESVEADVEVEPGFFKLTRPEGG